MLFNHVCVCAGPDPKPVLRGDNRTYRVWLDPNQYQLDMTNTVKGGEVSANKQCWKISQETFEQCF
jgi:hypothetical protein